MENKMKKMLIAIGIGLIAGSAYAATIGCMTYDDSGCSVAGNLYNGNGIGLLSMTKAAIAALTPTQKGQVVFCSDCSAAMGSKGLLCYSTATVVGSYVQISSLTAVTVCN